VANVKRVFTVNGEPFFPVGGQSMNQAGQSASEAEAAFKAVKLLHGNTLEIPVYWEQVEPEEGRFDFSIVDALLASARRYGMKLVLLWFATWKNGNMDYTPTWVKTSPQRFRRVASPTGRAVWVLSSHCRANTEADQRAFTALCAHLKAVDSTERTVIALQIENEPGILGSDRDYGPEAQATFESPVPDELVSKMKAAGKGPVFEVWQEAGGKEGGSWPELFGWAGGELMTAWSIATTIDGLAEAGKAVYGLPMYINVWLARHAWAMAGEDYPSGGAVPKVLDIYKWFTPHVDLIAPDIYLPDNKGYESMCRAYARDDNPLFVPESGGRAASNAWLMFRAIADYNAIGYHGFGVEWYMAEDGSVRPEAQMVVDSFRCVSAVIPLLLKYQGTGKIHAVVQEENMESQELDLDGYVGQVQFDGRPRWFPPAGDTAERRGRGLVIQASQHEFYLVGSHYQLVLHPKLPPHVARDMSLVRDPLLRRSSQYLSVDEGHFDEKGEFVVDHQRNGDEIRFAAPWVEPDIGVLRVVMCD